MEATRRARASLSPIVSEVRKRSRHKKCLRMDRFKARNHSKPQTRRKNFDDCHVAMHGVQLIQDHISCQHQERELDNWTRAWASLMIIVRVSQWMSSVCLSVSYLWEWVWKEGNRGSNTLNMSSLSWNLFGWLHMRDEVILSSKVWQKPLKASYS